MFTNFMTQMPHVYFIIWPNCNLVPQLSKIGDFGTQPWSLLGQSEWGVTFAKESEVGGQMCYFKN